MKYAALAVGILCTASAIVAFVYAPYIELKLAFGAVNSFFAAANFHVFFTYKEDNTIFVETKEHNEQQ